MHTWGIGFHRGNGSIANEIAAFLSGHYDYSCDTSNGRIYRVYDNDADESLYDRNDHDSDAEGLEYFLDNTPIRVLEALDAHFGGGKHKLTMGAKTLLPFPKDTYKPARRMK